MRERRLGTSDGTTTREDLGADRLLIDVANYVVGYEIKSRDAVKTARHAILDFVACALRSVAFRFAHLAESAYILLNWRFMASFIKHMIITLLSLQ